MGAHLSCLHKRRSAAARLAKKNGRTGRGVGCYSNRRQNGGEQQQQHPPGYVVAEYLVDFGDCKLHQNCRLLTTAGPAAQPGKPPTSLHGNGDAVPLRRRPMTSNQPLPNRSPFSKCGNGGGCSSSGRVRPSCPVHGSRQPQQPQSGSGRNGAARPRLGYIPAAQPAPQPAKPFATVANRLSISFDEKRLSKFVATSPSRGAESASRVAPSARIPLESPVDTPPPSPPPAPLPPSSSRRSAAALTTQAAPPSQGSQTSLVNFLKRTNSTESQFKVTVRRGRGSRAGRQHAGPRVSFRPAITRAAAKTIEVIDTRPTVEYRPRYTCLRRSLVEGLERMHLLQPAELAVDEEASDSGRKSRRDSVRAGGDSEPRAHSEPGGGGSGAGTPSRRRCQTVSRDPPRSPSAATLAAARKDPNQRTFYFFHIRASSLAQSEAFLFDSLVVCLARRYGCWLRLVPMAESQDLPPGLRRVEVAGPGFREIRRFLHQLTASPETQALHQRVQERFLPPDDRCSSYARSFYLATSNGELQASLV
ncbi:hypothetical protein BOX15_Mlig029423g1 [Macrostomum lignano]|uniref:Uncharacterized protein n=1 Tax=Macrostomum lignano TaxID=282301 RepID=A0A267DER5_9PLAT|nr:hypothetical protein BOX15_Mlig029423g1 [Macrostomum lignano]